MKGILFVVFAMFLMLNAKGQSVDSTTIHLEQYKQWFDKGLISESEYKELKAKALNLSQPVAPVQSVTPDVLNNLKRNYKIGFIGGFVLETIGSMCIMGAYNWNNPSAELIKAKDGLANAKAYEKKFLIGIGSVALISGGAFLIIGGIDCHKYNELKLTVAPTGVALSMNF